MSQHTPRPWKVEKRGGDGSGYPITDPVSVGAFPWLINVPAPPFALGAVAALVSYENGEANAHLIAAAPDLLVACRALVDGWIAMDDLEQGAIVMARAAIAKAEGR